MPTITVTTPFKFAERGIDIIGYPAGVHDVSDRCREVAVAEKWATAGGKAAAGTPRPEGDALMAAIAAAIDGLDPEQDFTRDGEPKVEALEVILGYGISAAGRTAAWASLNDG